ncbi:glycosyltransferase [Fundidesulfovibrio butyratiphilus]
MPATTRRTFLFIPPVRKPTGGVAVLWDMARLLHRAGLPAFAVLREPAVWTPQGELAPTVDFVRLDLTAQDLWIVPEGWTNALVPGLRAGAECLVYVQNWAYLFSGLPPGARWRDLPVEFLAVSDPVAWFVEHSLGRRPPVLRPGIDLEVFTPPRSKPDALTVAYMPRKNRALAEQIRAVFEARGRFAVRWAEIAGLDRAGVAAVLRESHVFLATGYPEGCPLPPLEAMASGAVPVGFAGLGGFDYMRQVRPEDYRPACALRPVEWAGNGFYVADADVMGCVFALENALALWHNAGVLLHDTLAAGQATAASYDLASHRRALLELPWFQSGSGGQ